MDWGSVSLGSSEEVRWSGNSNRSQTGHNFIESLLDLLHNAEDLYISL